MPAILFSLFHVTWKRGIFFSFVHLHLRIVFFTRPGRVQEDIRHPRDKMSWLVTNYFYQPPAAWSWDRWKNFIAFCLKTNLTTQATQANQATKYNQTIHHFLNHVTKPNQFLNHLQNQFQNRFQRQFQNQFQNHL